jgi:hypothetical protein
MTHDMGCPNDKLLFKFYWDEYFSEAVLEKHILEQANCSKANCFICAVLNCHYKDPHHYDIEGCPSCSRSHLE